MSKKQDVIAGIRSMSEQAIEELNDIPDSVFEALKEYECEGASRCGHVKLKLRVDLPEWPNAGAVPRRGSDVGTSPLLDVSGSKQ